MRRCGAQLRRRGHNLACRDPRQRRVLQSHCMGCISSRPSKPIEARPTTSPEPAALSPGAQPHSTPPPEQRLSRVQVPLQLTPRSLQRTDEYRLMRAVDSRPVSGQDLERLMKANESACVARQSFPFGPGNTRNRDNTTNLQGAAALHAQRNMRTAIENDPRFEGTPFTATTAAAVRLTRGGACAEFAEAAFAEHAAKLEPGHVVERRSRPEEIKHNTHGWVAERPPGADDAHQLVLDSWAEGVAPFQPDSHLRDTRYRVLQSAAPDDAPVIRQAIEDTIRDTADLQQLAN
jgi:hypothetical protein